MNKKPTQQSSNSDQLSKREQSLQSPLQNHLDAEVESLDFNVTHKLAAARRRALTQHEGTSRARFNWQLPAAGFAVLALTLILGKQFYSPHATPGQGTDSELIASASEGETATQSELMEDLQMLSASDDIEFYQSVEFLEWMDSDSG